MSERLFSCTVGTWGGKFQTEMIKNLSDLNFINQLIEKSMGNSAMEPSEVQGHRDVLIMVSIPIQWSAPLSLNVHLKTNL